MKNINEMTRQEIMNTKERKWGQGEFLCDSLIIIPSEINRMDILKYKLLKYLSGKLSFIRIPDIYEIDGLHDSGYRAMSFVAISKNEPLCKIDAGSDVIEFDGIGGYGKNWINKQDRNMKTVDVAGWQIDCLRTSGLLRIFCNGKILCGEGLSSYEIWRQERKE